METDLASTEKVDFNLLSDYYMAVDDCSRLNDALMVKFKNEHPNEYRFFSCVHHKRSKVRSNLEAMITLGKEIYFGTLTYNQEKNDNQVVWKRKEAFEKLNKVFEYFLLVEENGEENGRYHIHFVGIFRDNKSFEDFKENWHSRQNLEKVKDNKKVVQYLIKYVSKELPRIRRNKALTRLENGYRIGLKMERIGFKTLNPENMVKKVHFINALDEI